MSGKKVTFFRSSVSSTGELYKSPLASYTIPSSMSDEEAVEYAKREFCAWARISEWSELAESYDIE